jgi:spore coat protein A
MSPRSRIVSGIVRVALALTLASVLCGTGAWAAQVTINPIQDNTIYSNDGAVSCGAGAHLITGRTDGGVLRRALFQFDVAGTVTPGSVITGVSLQIVVNRVRDSQARTVFLNRLTESWGEAGSNCDGNEGEGAAADTNDTTWVYRFFNSSSWSTLGGTFNPTASTSMSMPSSNGTYTWTGGNLVADVQDMLDNSANNLGWIVISEEGVNKTARRFYSRNEAQVSRRPVLIIDFTPPSGSEACCTLEGFCSLEDPAACTGTVLPGVTTCIPNQCIQPQGACCSALGGCQEIGQADCFTQGDTFQGELTVCTPNPCSGSGLAKFVDALPIPALATPTTGTIGGAATYDLAVTEFQQQLHRDLPPTTVWGYGGSFPGPTIVAARNEPVVVNWSNDLRDGTGALRTSHYLTVDTCPHGPDAWGDSPRIVAHLHGAHVPARYDGYPEAAYPPGFSDTYIYPNNQLPGTLWYHDHSLGITRLNVYMGMAGFYLLTDPYEQGLNLPSGEFEIGLAIQDRVINPDGTWSYPTTVKQNFFGDTILVNGMVWPFLNVKQGKYRFRLLEGSNSRTYTLALSNGAPFQVIGTELGLVEHPVTITELTFGPGERYDVIIDFASYAAGTEIILENSAPIKFPNSTNVTEGVIPDIMKFIVTADPGHTIPLPATLRPYEIIPEAQSVATRTLTLARDAAGCGGGEWLINGKHWDDITEIPDLGNTEIWEWYNDTDIMHPMHMHLVGFQILDRFNLDPNGVPTGPPIPPEPHEVGWKDTALAHARTVTRVIATFEDYVGKYAYHCHILEHEDHEMMRQFRTVTSNCNSNGTCDPGEDCIGCAADCAALSGAACGNGLCEAGNGEDCVSCPQDCNGKQNGNLANQFCCGDGDGTNPVDCNDLRCSTGGFFCRASTRPPACCGDLMCEGSETVTTCVTDCSADGDLDGFFDYADCDDAEPLAGAVPDEVTEITIQDLGGGSYRFLWDSLGYQAGSGTVYDVYSGFATDLNADGGLQSGSCLVEDVAASELIDPTPTPAPGEIRYFLLRGKNLCPGGPGTFGDANRDSTHSSSPDSCS